MKYLRFRTFSDRHCIDASSNTLFRLLQITSEQPSRIKLAISAKITFCFPFFCSCFFVVRSRRISPHTHRHRIHFIVAISFITFSDSDKLGNPQKIKLASGKSLCFQERLDICLGDRPYLLLTFFLSWN